MESPDFYLTLHSNASMNTHPDNTLTHYITTLPSQLVRSVGMRSSGDTLPAQLVQRETAGCVVRHRVTKYR